MKKIAYVGIDYHENTLTIAVYVKNKIHDTVRIRNEDKIIRRYLKKLSNKFDILDNWKFSPRRRLYPPA
jgi:hypothetical protein